MDKHEELAIATAHVERGVRLVEHQRRLIAHLTAKRMDIEMAQALLEKLEMTLATLCDHRDLIRREVAEERLLAKRGRIAATRVMTRSEAPSPGRPEPSAG